MIEIKNIQIVIKRYGNPYIELSPIGGAYQNRLRMRFLTMWDKACRGNLLDEIEKLMM